MKAPCPSPHLLLRGPGHFLQSPALPQVLSWEFQRQHLQWLRTFPDLGREKREGAESQGTSADVHPKPQPARPAFPLSLTLCLHPSSARQEGHELALMECLVQERILHALFHIPLGNLPAFSQGVICTLQIRKLRPEAVDQSCSKKNCLIVPVS